MKKSDFSTRVRNLGLKIYEKAKVNLENVKRSTETNILNDKLRRRFNLENPFKFLITNESDKSTIINKHVPIHAKRYNEDDIFVFYGNEKDNQIKIGDTITDLSDESTYKAIQLVDVTVPVKYEDQYYDVPCVAVYGETIK